MLQHTSSEVINIQLQIPVNSFPEHPKNQVFFPLPVHKKKTSSGQKLCTEQTAGIAMISIRAKQNADYITEEQNILKHHKTAEVLYKQLLWYFQPQNSFSEHPKNQVFFP